MTIATVKMITVIYNPPAPPRKPPSSLSTSTIAVNSHTKYQVIEFIFPEIMLGSSSTNPPPPHHCPSRCPIYGAGNGTPLQYSCLENPMDEGAWWAAVHGVAKSWARLSAFAFTYHFHALEKEMATPSSVLAWRIPRMGEPGGLPFMGSHRVGHN